MTRATIGIAAAIAAMVVVVLGLRMFDDRSGPPIVIDDPRPDATIVVAVDGAVATPGVYALNGDARLHDALAAAGGAVAGADLSAINPAQRLRDEDRIVVPFLPPTAAPAPSAAAASAPTAPGPGAGERPSASGPTAVPSPTREGPTQTTAVADPIDVNTASAAELDALPGIGPVLAQRIVDYRAEHGPFRSIEELANVQGISTRMVEELRPLVTVGP